MFGLNKISIFGVLKFKIFALKIFREFPVFFAKIFGRNKFRKDEEKNYTPDCFALFDVIPLVFEHTFC